MELLIRFLIGGMVVCLFAALGDVVRPKSFAGIFGAAPSIALATVAITLHLQGADYAATEARSMMIGAFAMAVYAWVASRVLWGSLNAARVTLTTIIVWFVIAFGGWFLLLERAS
jgi:uncharacterized membrane protein (GlpM family)